MSLEVEHVPVTLTNIGKDGLAEELFQHELKRVAKNMIDENTDARQKRKITLTFEFVPNNDRTLGAVEISAKSDLAALSKQQGTVQLFQGKLFTNKYSQGELFAKVHSIEGKGE